MKTYITSFFIISSLLLFSNCSDGTSETVTTSESNESKTDKQLKYSLHKDSLTDEPWGSRVEQEVVLEEGSIKEEQLRELLTSLYDKAKSSTKSQYFEHPTSIYIFIYASKEKAEAGGGQWIGKITQNDEDGNRPEITISKQQLNLLSIVEQNRFGFTENERQQLYKEITNIELQTIDNENLKPQYLKVLSEKHNTTVAILDSIEYEGFSKGWTPQGL